MMSKAPEDGGVSRPMKKPSLSTTKAMASRRMTSAPARTAKARRAAVPVPGRCHQWRASTMVVAVVTPRASHSWKRPGLATTAIVAAARSDDAQKKRR